MNIEYLKNFVTIVDEKTISQASKKLFIAQPSLSNQIKYLEELYNTKLMIRGGQKIRLTKSGEALYKSAKEIIKVYEQSHSDINDLNNNRVDSLNIAIPPTIYKEIISKSFLEFSIKYPDAKLNIYEARSAQAEELINNGTCELGITNANVDNLESFNYIELEKEQFKVFMPLGSLLNIKDEITLSDLENLPLAIPRGYINNILEHAHSEGTSPNIQITTSTSIGALEIAKLRNIYAIIPLPDDEIISEDYIVKPLNLSHYNTFSRKLIWKKNQELSTVAKNFVDCI